MLYPHEDSKAFLYTSLKQKFNQKLGYFADNDVVGKEKKAWIENILAGHDLSVGTPPVTEATIDYLAKVIIGNPARELRRFKDVIGVIGDKIGRASCRE